jgi:hypothetical protein
LFACLRNYSIFSTTISAEQGQIYTLTFLGLPNWVCDVWYGLATKKQQPTLSLFVAPNLNTSKQASMPFDFSFMGLKLRAVQISQTAKPERTSFSLLLLAHPEISIHS